MSNNSYRKQSKTRRYRPTIDQDIFGRHIQKIVRNNKRGRKNDNFVPNSKIPVHFEKKCWKFIRHFLY